MRRYGGDFDLLLPGARIHAAGAHGCYPLASLHVTACLGVFATELTRDLAGRMEIDRVFAAARTLGVVFPVMGQSLQSELGARRRRAGGGGGGGGGGGAGGEGGEGGGRAKRGAEEGAPPATKRARRSGVVAAAGGGGDDDGGGGGGGSGGELYTASAWAVRGLQMAKGLAHLHAHRVVHRDVKPDNVLTDGAAGGVGDDEDATLVVSDLGECLDMALHCEHGFETPAAHPRGGAAAYWSPEVAGAAVRTRGATIDYAKQVRVRACRCACVQSCLEPCRFARSRALPQDAWGLGYILWGMLSPDPAAAPYTRGGGYTEPPGTLGGRGVDGAAATALVRGLLRPAPGDRASLDDAVAALEAMLFVLPGIESARAGEEAVSRRCVLQPRDVAWGDESGRHVLRCALGVM